MEGRHEDVETSPSPFSYVVSPIREVDGLFLNFAVAWCMLRRQ